MLSAHGRWTVIVFALFACDISRAQPIFLDSFAPAPSPLWSNSVGNWTGDGAYYAQSPNNNPLTYTALPFDLTDFHLSVRVNSIGDGGIWLRTDGTNQNGVLLILGGQGYGEGNRSGDAGMDMYWHVVQNGSVGTGYGLVTTLIPGSTHTIDVTVIGDDYAAYLDGSATPATTLVDGTYSHGYPGLYDNQPGPGGSGPAMSFSDFSLSLVPEPRAVLLSVAMFSMFSGLFLRRSRHSFGSVVH